MDSQDSVLGPLERGKGQNCCLRIFTERSGIRAHTGNVGGGLEERIYHRGRVRVGSGMLRPNHLHRTERGKCDSAGD